jgi:hypothetical protein
VGSISDQYIKVSLGRKTLGLKESELARLVVSLRDLLDPSADAVAEEIGALKLAGVRVDLRPVKFTASGFQFTQSRCSSTVLPGSTSEAATAWLD